MPHWRWRLHLRRYLAGRCGRFDLVETHDLSSRVECRILKRNSPGTGEAKYLGASTVRGAANGPWGVSRLARLCRSLQSHRGPEQLIPREALTPGSFSVPVRRGGRARATKVFPFCLAVGTTEK